MTVPFNAFNKGEKAYMACDLNSAYASTGLAVGTLVGVDPATGTYVKADQVTGIKAETIIYEGSKVDPFGAYSANPSPTRFPLGSRESIMLGVLKEGAIQIAYDDGTAVTAFRMKDVALTGTVTVTTNTAIAGTNTLFLTELKVGEYVTTAGGAKRQVVAIASNTAATVGAAWGAGESGVALTANGLYGARVYLGDTTSTTKFSKWLIPQFTLIKPTTGEGLVQSVGWVDGKNIIRIDLTDEATVV